MVYVVQLVLLDLVSLVHLDLKESRDRWVLLALQVQAVRFILGLPPISYPNRRPVLQGPGAQKVCKVTPGYQVWEIGGLKDHTGPQGLMEPLGQLEASG